MNAEILRQLRGHATVKAYPVMPAPGSRGLRYHATKILRLVSALAGLVITRLKGCRTFYGSVDDGWGAVSTTAIAVVARISGYRIFFHHHSFRYVNRKTRLMRLLTRVAGPDACHVMLCDAMDAAFRANYPAVGRTIVVPNVVPAPPRFTDAPKGNDFTIGMLSNLMFEKGVREFVDLFEAALAETMPISAVLAGPAWNDEVESYLINAVRRNEGKLEWMGAVHGEAKERFFAAIDLFIFPTRYASECYPLVIVEALARGKPVISIDRGCIGAMASESVKAVPTHEDFAAAALPVIKGFSGRPREQREAQALADAAAINAGAEQACAQLIRRITLENPPPSA